jgi:hypothetical protein
MDLLSNGLDIGGSRILLITIGILSITILAVRKLLRVDHDPREPPIIPHQIPFVGHVIGMFRYGARYFDIIKYVNFQLHLMSFIYFHHLTVTVKSMITQSTRSPL